MNKFSFFFKEKIIVLLMIIIIFVIVLLSITLFSTACLQVNDIRMNYHLIAQHFYILKKKKRNQYYFNLKLRKNIQNIKQIKY